MKTNNTNSKSRVVLTGGIAVVATLALVTAAVAVVVASTMAVQTAHASCITSPKGDLACSGGVSPVGGASTSSTSHSNGVIAEAASGPSGGVSNSNTPNGFHASFSHNFQGRGNCADSTCSGNK